MRKSLLGNSALDILHSQATGHDVFRWNEVEDLRLRVLLEDSEVVRLHPVVHKVGIEVDRRVPLYSRLATERHSE